MVPHQPLSHKHQAFQYGKRPLSHFQLACSFGYLVVSLAPDLMLSMNAHWSTVWTDFSSYDSEYAVWNWVKVQNFFWKVPPGLEILLSGSLFWVGFISWLLGWKKKKNPPGSLWVLFCSLCLMLLLSWELGQKPLLELYWPCVDKAPLLCFFLGGMTLLGVTWNFNGLLENPKISPKWFL